MSYTHEDRWLFAVSNRYGLEKNVCDYLGASFSSPACPIRDVGRRKHDFAFEWNITICTCSRFGWARARFRSVAARAKGETFPVAAAAAATWRDSLMTDRNVTAPLCPFKTAALTFGRVRLFNLPPPSLSSLNGGGGGGGGAPGVNHRTHSTRINHAPTSGRALERSAKVLCP